MSNNTELREVAYEDCETATELLRDLGLIMPEGRDAVLHHWGRFWIDNPAFDLDRPNPARGWLLEDEGRMVGFFGNIPLLYYYGDRPVIVANASQWGVEKDYRAETHRLSESYFNQKHVDLLLVTTGIKPTGRIFERYRGVPVPQADYDRVLYWVMNGADFLKAALKKKNITLGISDFAAGVCGTLLDFATSLGGLKQGFTIHVDVINTDEINDSFDGLWLRKRGEAERLLACRSAECLRWHFGSEALASRTRILTSRDGSGLNGYAIIMREDSDKIGLKRLKIVDLFVVKDDPNIIDSLLRVAADTAQEEGCHVLEIIGLPAHLRQQILDRHHPFARRLPVWPLFYKCIDEVLQVPLSYEQAWYVTAFDGDTSIA